MGWFSKKDKKPKVQEEEYQGIDVGKADITITDLDGKEWTDSLIGWESMDLVNSAQNIFDDWKLIAGKTGMVRICSGTYIPLSQVKLIKVKFSSYILK